jgi:Tubulin like
MSTLILGPGGTSQEIILNVKNIATTLGLADRFLYFAFDVDRAIEGRDGLLPEERLWLRMADREDLRHHAAQWHLDPELLEYVHEKGTRGIRALGAFFATFNRQELSRQIRLRLTQMMERGEQEGQRTVVVLFSAEGGTGSSLGLYTLAVLRDVAQRERKHFQVHIVPVCPLIYNPHDDQTLVVRRQASGFRTLSELFLLQEPGAPVALSPTSAGLSSQTCPRAAWKRTGCFPYWRASSSRSRRGQSQRSSSLACPISKWSTACPNPGCCRCCLPFIQEICHADTGL